MDSFLELVLDQLRLVPGMTWRRLFGGYSLYATGIPFAIVYDGRLYFKADEAGREAYRARGMGPFQPGGAGDVALTSYWEVPADVLEDVDSLADWARLAVAAARAAKAEKARKAAGGKRRRPPQA